jgi:hypothetical protein
MTVLRALPILLLSVLIGAGCNPTGPGSLASLNIPKQNVPKNGEAAVPCLSFSHREGFSAWIDQYEQGTDAALALANQIHLPKKTDERFIANVRASLKEGASPSFVCTISNDGKDVAWIMEPEVKDGETCRDVFYVSINGKGTTSEITSSGRTTDCHQLCKPKHWEQDILVWQCDLREQDGRKDWSQMNMDKKTGGVEIIKCQKDALGMPVGCIE